jgi:hypothetical protein
MEAHSAYADRLKKLAASCESMDRLIAMISTDGTLNLHDLHATITPRESCELNVALINTLITLLKSHMSCQGVDVSKHALNAESKRLESYILRLSGESVGARGAERVSDTDSDSN